MSNHLTDCASYVRDLSPGQKLLLVCLADDSRDGSGRIAAPGLDVMQRWTSMTPRGLMKALAVLEQHQHIRKVQRGQKHVTAEFQLFPNGCCEVHRNLDRQHLPLPASTPVVSASPTPTTGTEPAARPAPTAVPLPIGPAATEAGSDALFPVDNCSQGVPPFTLRASSAPLSGCPPVHPESARTVLVPREELPPLPPQPRRRATSSQRVVAACGGSLDALDELVAELRVRRRDLGLPTSRWTGHAVDQAVDAALDGGYDARLVPAALRAVAVDASTQLPGRLAAPGPWWDAAERAELDRRRDERQADLAALRASCDCDFGWVVGPDGTPTSKCPQCHPAFHPTAARSTA